MISNDLIEALEAQKLVLLRKLASIEETINIIKENDSNEQNENFNRYKVFSPLMDFGIHTQTMVLKNNVCYTQSSPLRSKIHSILLSENRFLHVREIADIINQYEPDEQIDKLIPSISAALSVMKTHDDKNIVSYRASNSNKNVYWGFTKWYDNFGMIKEEHLPRISSYYIQYIDELKRKSRIDLAK